MPIVALLLLAAPPAQVPACALLTGEEIAEVQGAAPIGARPSEQVDGEVSYRSCYFQLPAAAQSVSLQLRQPAPGAARSVLQRRWRKLSQPREAEEGEHEKHGPRSVLGVGDSALFLGEARAGALYVLTGGAILRISVGGAATLESKIEACKQLAQRALARLPINAVQRRTR
jgi:hypothetical protein